MIQGCHIFRFSVCLLLIVLQAPLIHAEDIKSRMEESFEPWVETLIAEEKVVGLSIAVVADGVIAYSKAFGVRNTESGDAVTTRSLFHMASVTKPFVATALVQLVERGKVDLDATVVSVLPYFKLADERYREITIRQMLTHTSGMPDVISYEWHKPQFDDGALERFVRSFGDHELLWDPGTKRRYSNMAFDTLGDVIAKVSGMTFEDYVHENILKPLGMNDSTLLHAEAKAELMTSPHIGGGKKGAYPWKFFPYNRRHAPSSTLHSNADDMARWMLANLNRGELEGQRILPSASYDSLWAPRSEDDPNIGLSWFLGEFKGRPIVEHGGSDTGYKSNVTLFPDEGIGVAIMANFQQAPIASLRKAAVNLALGYDIDAK